MSSGCLTHYVSVPKNHLSPPHSPLPLTGELLSFFYIFFLFSFHHGGIIPIHQINISKAANYEEVLHVDENEAKRERMKVWGYWASTNRGRVESKRERERELSRRERERGRDSKRCRS